MKKNSKTKAKKHATKKKKLKKTSKKVSKKIDTKKVNKKTRKEKANSKKIVLEKQEVVTAASLGRTSASLGQKRTCHECGTKFYDFGKKDIFCPKCKKPYDFLKENEKIPRKAPQTVKPKKLDETAALLEEINFDDLDTFDTLDAFDDEDEKMVDEFDLDEKEDSEF